jgi:hypothetical protein
LQASELAETICGASITIYLRDVGADCSYLEYGWDEPNRSPVYRYGVNGDVVLTADIIESRVISRIEYGQRKPM